MVKSKKTTATEKGEKGGAKKTAAKKTTAKKAVGARKGRTSATPTSIEITPEERWRMTAVAAYHKSEKHGFSSGREMDDWLEAEREINELLGKR